MAWCTNKRRTHTRPTQLLCVFHGSASILCFLTALVSLLLRRIVIQRLFRHSEKRNVDDDNSVITQEQSRFLLPCKSVADVAKYIPVNDFPLSDCISEFTAHDEFDVIDDSATYYVVGFTMLLFPGKTKQGCCCLPLLRECVRTSTADINISCISRHTMSPANRLENQLRL